MSGKYKYGSVYHNYSTADEITSIPFIEVDLASWDRNALNQLIRDIETNRQQSCFPIENVPHTNILLIGPEGAGKSSFVNTVASVFRGRLTVMARQLQSNDTSKREFIVYTVKSHFSGDNLGINLCICRGFETLNNTDKQALLDGHLKSGYTFQEDHITKDNALYERHPMISDKMHCVVNVVDANIACGIEEISRQLVGSQDILNKNEIQQLILMTKIDKISENVQQDLTLTFHSSQIQQRAETLARLLRLPLYTVLPTKNVHIEHCLHRSIKILTLYNLRHMMRAADDHLENFRDELFKDKYERNYDSICL